MTMIIRQSTSTDLPVGPFLAQSDGFTCQTALTITQPTIRLKKNGGNWAQKAAAQTLSHEENGYYEVTLDATDTNTLGMMRLSIEMTGTLPVWEDYWVVTANIYDTFFSTDLFQVDLTQVVGGTTPTPTVTGVPFTDSHYVCGTMIASTVAGRQAVDTTHVSGTVQTAGDIIGDTNDIQARLPASLVSGRIDASVGAMAANTVTASAIASAAIDADSIATDAITAAKIATDAIDNDALAATAATEIAAAVKAAVIDTAGSITLQQALSVMLSALAGVTSSNGAILKTPDGTATRITASVDASNNRTSMTLNPSA